MTKTEMKEKYDDWNKGITKLSNRKSEIFQQLQDLNVSEGDGYRWCCLELLVENLVKAGQSGKAFMLMEEYFRIEGEEEALASLALVLDNFKI